MSRQVINIPRQSDLRSQMTKAWEYACQMMTESADSKSIKVTLQTASIRSLDANAAMWAALTDISERVLWHGLRLTAEEYKDLLSAGLVKAKVVPNIEGNGFVILGQRTSQMSIKEMGELLELIHAFGAEHDVRFSAPERSQANTVCRLESDVMIKGECRKVA